MSQQPTDAHVTIVQVVSTQLYNLMVNHDNGELEDALLSLNDALMTVMPFIRPGTSQNALLNAEYSALAELLWQTPPAKWSDLIASSAERIATTPVPKVH